MPKIKQITARQILNAKGNPTIETTVTLDTGQVATASVPSGTSVGSYEALELRDKDQNHFAGLGVLNAIDNIEKVIAPKLIDMEITRQQMIDRTMIELDGTPNKSHLGANAILSVSIAVAKAGATASVMPLYLYLRSIISRANSQLHIPDPLFNLINGGAHADDGLNFQEFIVTPATAIPFHQALEWGVAIDQALKLVLKNKSLSTLVGDEGGFGPTLANNAAAFALMAEACTNAGLRLGLDIFLGMDAAATRFYANGKYQITDKDSPLSPQAMSDYYTQLVKEYSMVYLEDPFAENDWDGWEKATQTLADKTIIVGDDLTATNLYRLQMAIDKKAITGIVIKPNQIGTVVESLGVVEVARSAGLKIIVAHRSGETNDDFIADFAVAVGADYCKFGAPDRGERVAKYNRLLQIEEQIRELR